jgi:hypothetical protein
MEISEFEDKISDLDNRIDELRFELNQQVGFITEAITQLDEDFITTAIINNLLPDSIKDYIVNNYKKFSSKIVSTLLESEYFYADILFRYNYHSNITHDSKILEEYQYLEYVLDNPNLSPYNKKEIKKRIAKHKRDLKNND